MNLSSIAKKKNLGWFFFKYYNEKNDRGKIGIIEYNKDISFNVKRVFFISDVPNNKERGLHSHKSLKQVLVCIRGSLKIELENGQKKKTYTLKHNNKALFVDGKVWRRMFNFSKDCLLLVLCDREYSKDKVIRDYKTFKKYALKEFK